MSARSTPSDKTAATLPSAFISKSVHGGHRSYPMKTLSQLETQSEKLAKAQERLPWIAVLACGSSALKYARVFRVGFLPPWLGFAVAGFCVFYWFVLSAKRNRLKQQISDLRPKRRRQCPSCGKLVKASVCPTCDQFCPPVIDED